MLTVVFLLVSTGIAFVSVAIFLFIMGMISWLMYPEPITWMWESRWWYFLCLPLAMIFAVFGHIPKFFGLKAPVTHVVALLTYVGYMITLLFTHVFFTGVVCREGAMVIYAIHGLVHYFVLFLVALLDVDIWAPLSIVAHLVYWAFMIPCIIGTIFVQVSAWYNVVSF